MNVLTVHKAALEALEKVRQGNGPYFLEIVTYRFRGHSMGDPERYREPEEIKKWQENDPIGIFHRYLTENSVLSPDELDEVEHKVEEEVQEAIQFAENSPEPPLDELFDNVYIKDDYVHFPS